MKQTRFFLDLGICAALIAFSSLLSSCSLQATPTIFVPPAPSPETQTPAARVIIPTSTLIPTAIMLSPTIETPCTNDLKFLNDVTVIDGTQVAAGAAVDKQWLVQNSGTCDWNAEYRLKFVGGLPLGATDEQALYPARANAQITIQIIFTAPSEAGTYESWWQAFDPKGNAFGEPIYMNIVVNQ